MYWILAAQTSSLESSLVHRLLSPDVLPFLVAVVALVVCGMTSIVKNVGRHRERIAMIEQGINPDDPTGRPLNA